MAIAMLMFSLVMATSYAVNVSEYEKKDTGILIESKEKAITYKITWNANSGRIGAKMTVTSNVKKGTKIKKLPTKPKRNGYTFQGWYTKKTGGKKISVNIKPTKSTTLYAHWKKGSSSTNKNSGIDKKLIGSWEYLDYYYNFDANGKFASVYPGYSNLVTGKYSCSNGKIHLTNLVYSLGGLKTNLKNQQYDYSIGKDNLGDYLYTSQFIRGDGEPFKNLYKFRKPTYN